jgi:hypothetical protein
VASRQYYVIDRIILLELRKNPRINVIWRGVIELSEDNIIPAKVANIASGGLLLHCAFHLEKGQEYRVMMEVPSIVPTSSAHYQVHCKMRVQQIILRGEVYHLNMQFTELGDLHQSLFDAWLSIINKHDQLV